jgi:hypothetical protein
MSVSVGATKRDSVVGKFYKDSSLERIHNILFNKTKCSLDCECDLFGSPFCQHFLQWIAPRSSYQNVNT